MTPDDLSPEDRELAQDKLIRNWLYRRNQATYWKAGGERKGDRHSRALAEINRARERKRQRERDRKRVYRARLAESRGSGGVNATSHTLLDHGREIKDGDCEGAPPLP